MNNIVGLYFFDVMANGDVIAIIASDFGEFSEFISQIRLFSQLLRRRVDIDFAQKTLTSTIPSDSAST